MVEQWWKSENPGFLTISLQEQGLLVGDCFDQVCSMLSAPLPASGSLAAHAVWSWVLCIIGVFSVGAFAGARRQSRGLAFASTCSACDYPPQVGDCLKVNTASGCSNSNLVRRSGNWQVQGCPLQFEWLCFRSQATQLDLLCSCLLAPCTNSSLLDLFARNFLLLPLSLLLALAMHA